MATKGPKSKGKAAKASPKARKTGKKAAAKPKAKSPKPDPKEPLVQKDLSLHWHILKLLVGSIFRVPDEQINVEDVLKSTKEWLFVTPFTRATLESGLKALTRKEFLRRVDEGGRPHYRLTEKGRDAYGQYRQVMTLWRVEKVLGQRLKLYTATEVVLKRNPDENDYLPDECFIDWPLKFRPVVHDFEGTNELRVYDAFERVKE